MSRAFLVASVVVLPGFGPALAQPAPAVKPIALSVQPAAEPSPALRYALLPEVIDQSTGNAAIYYLRAFSPDLQAYRKPDILKKIQDYKGAPGETPPADLRFVTDSAAMKLLDIAARKEHCSWGYLEQMIDGVSMLLPDVQGLRDFGRLLAIRARFEMQGKQFDRCIYTLQTGFGLARHVNEGQTLIHALVAAAITQTMCQELDELLQQPGAPNLYWALTQLPRPFINLRVALDGERNLARSIWPSITEMVRGRKLRALSSTELKELIDRLVNVARQTEGELAKIITEKNIETMAAKHHAEASKAIVAFGFSQQEVAALPKVQVALLHAVLEYHRDLDSLRRLASLPLREALPLLRAHEKRLAEEKAKQGDQPDLTILSKLLMPALTKVVFTTARVDRRIAALRCVEAVRLHAAASDGKLPAKLADIAAVPLPADPMTGQSFEYAAEGASFTLKSPRFADDRWETYHVEYHVTLKK
jgi:hypothetical protein